MTYATAQRIERPNFAHYTIGEIEKFCDQLSEILLSLRLVLEKETACLQDMDIHQIEEIASQKAQITYQYSKNIAIFEENFQIIGLKVPATIEKIKQQHVSLRDAIVLNHKVLQTVKDISENLVRKTAEKVEANRRPTTYGNPIANIGKARPAPAAALAIDRQL